MFCTKNTKVDILQENDLLRRRWKSAHSIFSENNRVWRISGNWKKVFDRFWCLLLVDFSVQIFFITKSLSINEFLRLIMFLFVTSSYERVRRNNRIYFDFKVSHWLGNTKYCFVSSYFEHANLTKLLIYTWSKTDQLAIVFLPLILKVLIFKLKTCIWSRFLLYISSWKAWVDFSNLLAKRKQLNVWKLLFACYSTA